MEIETTVYVYRNLHKNCYSVMHKGKVIGHAKQVFIQNPQFVVRPGGRDKVRATGKKTVHAFVKGRLVGVDDTAETWMHKYNFRLTREVMARYNPRVNDTFVDAETGAPILRADAAHCQTDFKIKVYTPR